MQIGTAGRTSTLWHDAVDLATEVYAKQYGAQVRPSPESFIVAQTDDGSGPEVVACAGLTFGADEPLFSERYLAGSLEEHIERAVGVAVDRSSVVEVGSLATRERAVGLEVIRATPIIAWCLGMRLILCTATKPLIKRLEQTGIGFVPLGPADPDRLGSAEEVERWGSYYEQEPEVGVIPLNALERLFTEATGRYAMTGVAFTLNSDRKVANHAGP
ncbi:thermostable hemolysin [Kitasatospora aureofaciens]|nr:thermostable hemolysin [Kitasatospora aureofaciens]